MQHLVLSPGVPALAETYLMGMMQTALTHGPAQAPQFQPADAQETHED